MYSKKNTLNFCFPYNFQPKQDTAKIPVDLDPGNVVVKGTNSPTRFSTSILFHHSNQPGPLTNGLKYFRFWLRVRRAIQNFMNLPGV